MVLLKKLPVSENGEPKQYGISVCKNVAQQHKTSILTLEICSKKSPGDPGLFLIMIKISGFDISPGHGRVFR